MAYSQDGIIGAGFNFKGTDALLQPGTQVRLISQTEPWAAGKFAMYIKANGAIGASAYVTVDMTTLAMYGSSVASATASGFWRNGSVAFVDGEYGWVFSTGTALPRGLTPPIPAIINT